MNKIKHSLLVLLITAGTTLITGNIAQAATNAGAAARDEVPEFSLEKKDQSAEDKRLHAKFEGDKLKIEKAIANTKTLISQSYGRPYLPELQLRLAELYIEQSRIVYFLRKIELGDPEGSAVKGLEANALKGKAIETYQRILNEYPDFSDRDKVHFFMAHEYRELVMLPQMVEQYQLLIKQYKNSPYISEAYLLLGDYYFSVPDLVKAKYHYSAVLAYPKSSAIDIARYKLAWVYINNNDFGNAIALLEKSVQGSGKTLDVDTYNRVDIRLEALTDLTFSYSKYFSKSSPQEAIDYFAKFAWSRAVYTHVLEKLAYRYLLQKKWSHAAYIYRTLAKLQNDSKKLLEYVDHILTCVREMNSFEQADKDITIIIKTLDTMRYSVHISDEDKQKAMMDYELYARDISTRLHEASKVSKQLADYEKVADAYKQYLEFFDNSPKYKEVQLNYAQTLFLAQRFAESGKEYEKIARNSNGLEQQKQLYNSTYSYYSALKNRKNLNYYQIVQATTGLRETGDLYAKLFPNSPQVANVQFNVAWVTYDQGQYQEAITGFDQFIQKYPKGKEAVLAVDLILDSYSQLEDFEGLIKYGKQLQNRPSLSTQIRQHVAQVVTAAESKIITNMAVASVNDWNSGKADLLNYAEANLDSSLGEKALHALFVAAKEKAELATMQEVGFKLTKQYPKSEQGESILKLLIDASLKSSQFRVLTQYLEAYAKQYPDKADAHEFLVQAAELRQILRQYPEANKDYGRLLKSKKTAKAQRQDWLLKIADNLQKLNQVDKAQALLEANRAQFDWMGKLLVDIKLANFYLAQARANNKPVAAEFTRLFKRVDKSYGSKVPEEQAVKNDVAQLYFQKTDLVFKDYMATQLAGTINDSVVAAKTERYQQLTEGYYAVLEYQAPYWSIKALQRLYLVNQEFASFLKNAPLPALEPEQISEYQQIIAVKVQEYNTEAEQLLSAGNELLIKIKLLDPELSQYLATNTNNTKAGAQFEFSPKGLEIGIQAFKQEPLAGLHKQLFHHPKNVDTQLQLLISYYQQRDYGQALTIANHLLNNGFELNRATEAKLYNLMGLSYLGLGMDTYAKESFQQALLAKSSYAPANINLTALYQNYGFTQDAELLKQKVNRAERNKPDNAPLIHPRASALFKE